MRRAIVSTDYDSLLGTDGEIGGRGNRWKRISRGPLHDVLTRALPDFKSKVKGEDICDLNNLAVALGMSKQGVYKWFKPGRKNQIPPNQVDRIVEMSAQQKHGGHGFKPITREDFWEFLPR